MRFAIKHIKSISVFLFVAVFLSSVIYFQNTRPYTCTFFAFDTFINLTLYGINAEEAAKKAETELIRLENELSLYRSDSYTSAFNALGVGEEIEVSDEFAKIIKKSLEISEKSGGAFDITVYPLTQLWDIKNRTIPPHSDEISEALKNVGYEKISLNGNVLIKNSETGIDLGGIAKGYAADVIKELLLRGGIKKGIINLGGNISTIGGKTAKKGWIIGITDPFSVDSACTEAEVRDMSVVTSGGYQRYFDFDGKRYHHIISPKNGYPAENLLASVTVICENSMLADALSTAVFILGEEEGRALLDEYGAKGIFVRNDGTIIKTY